MKRPHSIRHSHHTVKAEAGYKFDKWTDNAGKSFNDDTALEAESYLEDQTFTAHFTATEQTYKVKYLDEDKNVEIHDMSDPRMHTLAMRSKVIQRKLISVDIPL